VGATRPSLHTVVPEIGLQVHSGGLLEIERGHRINWRRRTAARGSLPRRQQSVLQSPDGSQAPPRTDRTHDAGQHARQRRAVARRVMLAPSPSDGPERRAVAGSHPRAGVRAAHGLHQVRHHRRRRAAELMREGAMKRPPAKKQSPPSAPAGKQYTWSIYHIKGRRPRCLSMIARRRCWRLAPRSLPPTRVKILINRWSD
jgi:hypothetical protein